MDKLITILKSFEDELSILNAIARGIRLAKTNKKDPIEKIMDQAITTFLLEMLNKESDRLLELLIKQVGLHLNEDEITNLLKEEKDQFKARFSLIIINDFFNRVKVDKFVMPIWVSEVKAKYKDRLNEIIVDEFTNYGYALSIEQLD